MADDDGGSSSEGNEPTDKIVMDVDGESKEFSAEDITNLLEQQANATQGLQETAAVRDAAAKYGVTVENFLERANESFGTVLSLIDKGVINDTGEIVPQKELDKPTKLNLPGAQVLDEKALKNLDLVAKGLTSLETVTKRLDEVQTDNATLMRLRIQDRLQGKFPALSEEDVSKILVQARNDQGKTNKSLDQFAQEFVDKGLASLGDLEKEFAKKYDVDIEAFNANKLNESEPDGGASAMLGERKVSFKTGKDTVTPRKATEEFFKRINQGE